MSGIPERKHTPGELPGMSRSHQRVAVAPIAVSPQKVVPSNIPLSVGAWLVTLIVLAVPILNIILYVYWAFISKGNQGRINFCRASLILMVVGLVLAVLFIAL